MAKDGKKIAVGAGVVAGVFALIFALTRRAKAAPPPPPPGLANLYGKVTDAQTGAVLPGVLASLDGMQAYTDSGGNYTLTDLDPGAYVLQFSKEGYETAVY